MTLTMTPPTTGRKRKPTAHAQKAAKAKGQADRRASILELYQDGKSQAFIANVTGLTPNRIGQILRKAGVLRKANLPPDQFADSDSLLTPAELRECRRENAKEPKALEWLAEQCTDRRHNGRAMPRSYTHDFSEIDFESESN